MIKGVPSGFVPCMIRSTMKKNLVAAVLLAAMTFPAGPVLVGELTTSMATATVTSRCSTRAAVPCGPLRSDSRLHAAARSSASIADIEPEKWALLLLEFCAAGWVLVRSERAQTRRGAQFHLLSGGQEGPFAETAIGFRTL